MTNQTIRTLILTAGLTMSFSLPVAALELSDDPKTKGRQIAEETDRRDLGFGDTRGEMKMVLTNEYGDVSERTLRMMTLENPDPEDGDKTLIVFDQPRDVKGTALLTHAHLIKPDDQWLFLPAIKRVKRISSANKSGPFVGSEFAYEDFSAQEVGKYDYTWVRDEPCPEPVADRTCHVVERTPLYENSGYTRQFAWTDTVDYQTRKLVFHNRRDDKLKTLMFSDYRQYLDTYWRAHDLFMENHLTGKTTRLTYDTYAFQTGLGESDFTRNALQRAR